MLFTKRTKMIAIKCKGSSTATLAELHIIQDDLKELPFNSYIKMRNYILERGFIAPFFVWSTQNGRPKRKDIVDGTQRHIVLTKMKAEGEEIPDRFPIIEIDAPDEKTAKKDILALSSQYGKISEHSIKKYLKVSGLEVAEVDSFVEMDAIVLDNLIIEDENLIEKVNKGDENSVFAKTIDDELKSELEDAGNYYRLMIHFENDKDKENYVLKQNFSKIQKNKTLWIAYI